MTKREKKKLNNKLNINNTYLCYMRIFNININNFIFIFFFAIQSVQSATTKNR